jgi:hypothetical protein
MQIISLIIGIILWPSLNEMMAVLDRKVKYLSLTAALPQNAYIQTWLCLFSAIATTLGLRSLDDKISLDKVISSLINVSCP